MNRNTVIKLLKRKLDDEFSTKREAALRFKISTNHLYIVINKGHPIPAVILSYLGLEKEPTKYREVNKNVQR